MRVFNQLLDFVTARMRMSHMYQPVMLITLLENGSKASLRTISVPAAARRSSSAPRRAITSPAPSSTRSLGATGTIPTSAATARSTSCASRAACSAVSRQ